MLGTCVGGSIGYFIVLAIGYDHVYGILLLSVWSIPALFVQSSPQYSYLGSLAQLTPIVVGPSCPHPRLVGMHNPVALPCLTGVLCGVRVCSVLGYQVSLARGSLTAERFAFARIEEICIGAALALLISSLLWPVSSIRLLRSEVLLSVTAFRMGLDKTMQYTAEQRTATPPPPASPRCSR